jgi:chloramphenicol O-acetyltransferase type A
MRVIDLENWSRRMIFDIYRAYQHPLFGLTANVDVTRFQPFIKGGGYSYSVAMVYLISRTANGIAEFRYRIRGESVVEHELVHPSTTIPTGENLFSFCYFDYQEDFARFAEQAAGRIAYWQQHPLVENLAERDDMLYMTAIPWVSFTSLMHPIDSHPPDSIPRFAWGRFFREGERLLMPLAVQGHHALMDGLHLGRYYRDIQALLDDPERSLGLG